MILLAALPILLLAANRSWIWDNPDFEDWSVYVGFFKHYLEFKWPFIANYKSSRLPWVLPGVALYGLLPDVVAHHVLYLSFLTAETLLAYVLLKRRFGTHAAFIAAAAIATATFSHKVSSYHTQAASTYLVAALALLDLPRHWPQRARAALAGAAFSIAVTTDLAVLPLAPLFALHAIASVRSPRTPARIGVVVAAGLAGAIAAWACLGLVNRALGGPFLFFVEQIHYSVALSRRAPLSVIGLRGVVSNIWDHPMLAMPMLTGAASVIFLAVQTARRRFDWAALEVFGFVVSMGGAIVMELRGLGGLEFDVLFHPFRVPMYLAIAALASGAPGEAAGSLRPMPAVAYAAWFVVPLAVLGATFSRLVLRAGGFWQRAASGVPFAIAIAAIAVLVALVWRRRPAIRIMAIAGGLGLVNAVCTDASQPAHMYQIGATCAFRGENFRALLEADQVLSQFDPDNIARWKSGWTKIVFEPAFDGKGWCTDLPIDLVSRAALLARYFWTSADLARGYPDDLPLKKLTLTATSAAQMEALVADVSTGVPPTMSLALRVDRRFSYSTFTLYLRGYDIVPLGAEAAGPPG